MDIKQMAKMAGVSEDKLKGKSTKEQIKIISKAMSEAAEKIEIEASKELIDNTKKVSKVQDVLENDISILAKNIGKKSSATQVSVVGYNFSKKLIIVLSKDKLYQIKETDIIKSIDDLKTSKKTTTTKKK